MGSCDMRDVVGDEIVQGRVCECEQKMQCSRIEPKEFLGERQPALPDAILTTYTATYHYSNTWRAYRETVRAETVEKNSIVFVCHGPKPLVLPPCCKTLPLVQRKDSCGACHFVEIPTNH